MLEISILIIFIILSGFFSGAEIALFSLSDVKLRKLLKTKKKSAKALKKLKERPHRLLVTILICNNVVNIGSASLATVVATKAFGSTGIGIAVGIMTFLILVFGEIFPKSLFHQKAESMSLFVARPLYVLIYLLYPLIVFLELINKAMLRILGIRNTVDEITEEEVMAALSLGAEAGVINRDEEEMIENVIDFGDSNIGDIMTPKSKIMSISSKKKLIDVITKMLQTKYSRIPVYRNSKNNIIGLVNIRHILGHIKKKEFDICVEKLVEPIIFVKESNKLDQVFDLLKENAKHMAVVLDKEKNVSGIVTMEDLLEEIVGEIYDEADIKRIRIHYLDKKTAIVNGNTMIKELQETICVPLKGKNYTISDVISSRFGNKPIKGQRIEMKNFILTVAKVDKKAPSRINRVKITKRRGRIR